MCGIAGLLAPREGDPPDERALRRMTAALAARGPDGEGFHRSGPVALGHRRLAIIDVEGGQQPLLSEDGEVAAVVNGEIYNFAGLRRELEAAGHRFATRSDSEVVVHGYEEWGDGVLERIDGMFALAVWDARARRLLLARDRMGEKPLVYAPLPGGGLAFASELKALRHAPGLGARLDPGALARYLVYEYVPAPRTILRGAYKLEPGARLVVRPGEPPVVARYWQLPVGPLDDEGAPLADEIPSRATLAARSADDAARLLLAELRRSVRERLVADVPLGVFLSGGLDSSTVAVLAAEVRGRELDTFAIGFDDPTFDESAEARRVARAIGSRHHEDRLSPALLLDLLPAIGELLDEPLGDGSIAPTHLLARFARRHVTVALGGDGGDELFFGYPTFAAERVAGLVFDRAPAALGRAAAAVGSAVAGALPVSTGYFSLDFKLKQFPKGHGHRGARRHQAWLGSFAPADALAALAPEVARAAAGDLYDVIDERLATLPRNGDARARWDRLFAFYARGYLGDDVLMKVDRATMAVGLEARAPLLGTRVVTLASRLLPSLRLRGLAGKWILKRAMRGLLPDETLGRKKQGFGMPIGRWLTGPLRPLLEEDLGERRLREGGIFEPGPIRRLVDEHVTGRADHRKPLWTILAFQRWQAAFGATV